MEKKDLSKLKYIYRVYINKNIVHCERYPIIYINSLVVYFKESRKQEYLNYVHIDRVKNEFAGITEKDIGYYDRYFWNVGDFNSAIETAKTFKPKETIKIIKDMKSSLDAVEKKYLKLKEKYEEFISEQEVDT